MKKLRWIHFSKYPASSFPSNFHPTELRCLELKFSRQQKELWHGYKRLPNLKVLNLLGLGLIKTPDFGGLPCLERLILRNCLNLEEIHPSIGYHKKLVFVDMSFNSELKRFPAIIQMKKLETLILSDCNKLQQFPDIQSNMDSLVTLDLRMTSIEIIPPSAGQLCRNLVSFDLSVGCKLKRIEGNFHLLKSLKKLDLWGCGGLQSFHQDRLRSLKLPQFPRSLRKLNIGCCNLRDRDIPSDIGELLNLQVLVLSRNRFSTLPSSLSRLPCLKYLDLSYCEHLVKLSNLPSSIAILNTNRCDLLESVVDLSDYKRLWKVTLWRRIDKRVLLSMLEANAVEEQCMSIFSLVDEPSSIFKRLVTLQLPPNWYNDFSGFLLVLPIDSSFRHWPVDIVIKHEISTDHHSEEFDEDWEHDFEMVGYVPFSSLRHIPWLNPTYTKKISFQADEGYLSVELVSIKSKVGYLNKRPIDYSEYWDEEMEDKTFEIKYDSKSANIVWRH